MAAFALPTSSGGSAIPKPTKPDRGTWKTDPAKHRETDIVAVWGAMPACVHTGLRAHDGHHVLGRGYEFGYKPDHPERAVFSSIFGFIPLSRSIHSGPLRDAPDQRLVYLRVAKQKVMEAVGRGRYELRVEDRRFLEIAEEWKARGTGLGKEP